MNVPTTEEELVALGVLGDQKVKEYGDRLLRQIKKFVEDNDLFDSIPSRPAKRVKASKQTTKKKSPPRKAPSAKASKPSVVVVDDDDDDEFNCDIDFNSIPMP